MLIFLSSCSFKTNPAQKIAELFGSQTSQVSSTSDNDNVENNQLQDLDDQEHILGRSFGGITSIHACYCLKTRL